MNNLLKIVTTTLISSILAGATFAGSAPNTTAATEAATNATNNVMQSAAAASTAETNAQTSQLTVTSAVARPSMEGSRNSAAYITLHNNSAADITIIGASSMSAANTVELHTVTDDAGIKKMVKVDRLVVPAGGDLVMQQGGIHIMLINLKKLLKVGDKFDIELHTIELGAQTVSVEVVQM